MPSVFTAHALLLDMDGTLVNSDAVVERCWSRWAGRHGLDPAVVLPTVHGRQGHLTMAEFLPERSMAEHHAENALVQAEETADLDGVVPVLGAPVFLASLAGRPHALVTSAGEALARARMGAAGLPLPPVLVTAERVSASKPDPEGFLKGAAELGFAPEECLVFEDAQVGIAAARAAGMRVVGVGPRAAVHAPTAHVASLEDVRVETTADGRLRVTAG
ncbi:HAD-IA family hydrolase [Streptomyces sp.]|uniref:HAD-IA family hydrolase n=1 Tax=Streptomyces sp. TaxID=1931 RepID=UPI002F3E771F